MITATEAKTLSDTYDSLNENLKIHLENIEKLIITTCHKNLCTCNYNINNLYISNEFTDFTKCNEIWPGLVEKIIQELQEKYGYKVSITYTNIFNYTYKHNIYLLISWN